MLILSSMLTFASFLQLCEFKDVIDGEIPMHINYADKCEKCLACFSLVFQINDTFSRFERANLEQRYFPTMDVLCKQSIKPVKIKNFNGQFGNDISVLVSEYCKKVAKKWRTDFLYKKWQDKSLEEILCSREEDDMKSCTVSENHLAEMETPKISWWAKIRNGFLSFFSKGESSESSEMSIVYSALKHKNFCQ